jgi:hypothetical protein
MLILSAQPQYKYSTFTVDILVCLQTLRKLFPCQYLSPQNLFPQ